MPHMTPDEFRSEGAKALEWVARYMETVEDYPVLSRVEPGEVRAKLPLHPPEHGDAFDAVLTDLDEIIMPGITHWQSPSFFAFFNGNTSGPSILGELVAAGIAPQGMMWATSPAATELETHVLDWLAEMLDLPERFRSTAKGGGVIQDTASSATFTAVVAARERATNGSVNERGFSQRLTAYASVHAHSSIEKAVRLAGIGSQNLRLVEVDATHAMDPTHLAELIKADIAAGHIPAFVNATAGTTSSLAFDPIRPIGEICAEHDIWLHVDAAWAGNAAVCPEFRWMHDGLEHADSYLVNPHKWMFTNVDLDAFYVADRSALTSAMGIHPEYLRSVATEEGGVIDYRNWHVALGRRFRALKLWFVIRHYGVEGIRTVIREHVRLGQLFRTWVDEHPDFEAAAPTRLNLVCFRHVGGDEVNQAIMDEVNAGGEIYITHTRLDGRLVLRLNVGQTYTEERHVRRAWELIGQRR